MLLAAALVCCRVCCWHLNIITARALVHLYVQQQRVNAGICFDTTGTIQMPEASAGATTCCPTATMGLTHQLAAGSCQT
jgi:hypothetical protein